MASVTIEGSGTWVGLARGQRKTVAVTERVERLIARGFVVEISRTHDDTLADSQQTETVTQSVESSESEDDDTESEEQPQPEHPPYNANRDVWADFLANHEPPIEFSDKDGRDELVKRWQQAIQVQQ